MQGECFALRGRGLFAAGCLGAGTDHVSFPSVVLRQYVAAAWCAMGAGDWCAPVTMMVVPPPPVKPPLADLQQQWEDASSTMAMKDVTMAMPAKVEPAPPVNVGQMDAPKPQFVTVFKNVTGSTPIHPKMAPTRNRTKANTLWMIVATPRVWQGLVEGEEVGVPLSWSRAFTRQTRKDAQMPAMRERIIPMTNNAVAAAPMEAAIRKTGHVAGDPNPYDGTVLESVHGDLGLEGENSAYLLQWGGVR